MRIGKLRIIQILILFLAVFAPVLTFAHSDKIDSKGGHYDQKTGEYHYHNAPKQSSFAKKVKKYVSPANETASSQDFGKNIDSTREEKKEEIVYISKAVKKYHRENCKYLKSKIPMEKKEAIKKGYEACKLCNLWEKRKWLKGIIIISNSKK